MKTFVKDVRELVHRGISLSSHSIKQAERDLRFILVGELSVTDFLKFIPTYLQDSVFQFFLPPVHPSIPPSLHPSIHPSTHVIFTKYIIKATETESEPSQGVLFREDGLELFFHLTTIHWPLLQDLGSYTLLLLWVTNKVYGCYRLKNLSNLAYIPYTLIPSLLITLY